jgi:hypothetical protein
MGVLALVLNSYYDFIYVGIHIILLKMTHCVYIMDILKLTKYKYWGSEIYSKKRLQGGKQNYNK